MKAKMQCIQPMTGIQKMVQEKKLKEKAEEMEEAMMKAKVMAMYLGSKKK
jgi:hypothetical protein